MAVAGLFAHQVTNQMVVVVVSRPTEMNLIVSVRGNLQQKSPKCIGSLRSRGGCWSGVQTDRPAVGAASRPTSGRSLFYLLYRPWTCNIAIYFKRWRISGYHLHLKEISKEDSTTTAVGEHAEMRPCEGRASTNYPQRPEASEYHQRSTSVPRCEGRARIKDTHTHT